VPPPASLQKVITLNDNAALIAYATPIVAELRSNMARVDADFSATPFKAKISNAELGWGEATDEPARGDARPTSGRDMELAWFLCASTTAARKARSRRRKSSRIFWRASKSEGRRRATNLRCSFHDNHNLQ